MLLKISILGLYLAAQLHDVTHSVQAKYGGAASLSHDPEDFDFELLGFAKHANGKAREEVFVKNGR